MQSSADNRRMESKQDELKRLVAAAKGGRGHRYPKPVLEQLVAYARARRKQGATLMTIADEVGVGWKSLSRWLVEPEQSPRLHRVRVVVPPAGWRVVVHAPHGVRIEGLDVAGIAELLRKLEP